MEQQHENIGLVKRVWSHFYDSVALTDQELFIISQYLFARNYKLPGRIREQYSDTLDYFLDLIKENHYRNIKELALYFDNLIDEAKHEFKEALHELDGQPDKTSNYCAFDWHDHIYYHDLGKYLNVRERISSFLESFNSEALPETVNSGNDALCNDSLLNHPLAKDFFQSRCGSWSTITQIHSNLFAGDDSVSSLYVYAKNGIEHLSINDIDQPYHVHLYEITSCKHSRNWGGKKLNRYYESLIKRLSKEKPIFDEGFKIELAQWLISLKVENIYLAEAASERKLQYFNCTEHSDTVWKMVNELARMLYEKVGSMDWTILRSQQGHSWLTTDNPGFCIQLDSLTAVTESLLPDAELNYVNEESIVYFPVTKDYCLRIQPNGNKTQIRGDIEPINFKYSTDVEFKTINEMTMSTKKKLVISGDKKTLEQFTF